MSNNQSNPDDRKRISSIAIIAFALCLLGSQISFRLIFLGFNLTALMALILGLKIKKSVIRSKGSLLGIGMVNFTIIITSIYLILAFIKFGLELYAYNVTRPVFKSFLDKIAESDYENSYNLTSLEFKDVIGYGEFLPLVDTMKNQFGRYNNIKNHSFLFDKRELTSNNLNINGFATTYTVEYDKSELLFIVSYQKAMGEWRIRNIKYQGIGTQHKDMKIGVEAYITYIGGHYYVNLFEFWDFIAGIFGFDPAKDDEQNLRKYYEIKKKLFKKTTE